MNALSFLPRRGEARLSGMAIRASSTAATGRDRRHCNSAMSGGASERRNARVAAALIL